MNTADFDPDRIAWLLLYLCMGLVFLLILLLFSYCVLAPRAFRQLERNTWGEDTARDCGKARKDLNPFGYPKRIDWGKE